MSRPSSRLWRMTAVLGSVALTATLAAAGEPSSR